MRHFKMDFKRDLKRNLKGDIERDFKRDLKIKLSYIITKNGTHRLRFQNHQGGFQNRSGII